MADVDIWIYPGEVVPEDILLGDPTMAREEEEPTLIRDGVVIGPYLII